MYKVIFICHGNICRSPTAALLFTQLVDEAGLAAQFEISSAATSTEELGNGVYPPMQTVLKRHGINPSGHRAHRLSAQEAQNADLLVIMDSENRWGLSHLGFAIPAGKVVELGQYGLGGEIDDPWYTRDFERAYAEIEAGCEGLLLKLKEQLPPNKS
ncbi:MAG: low molecular weight phosphotyrosine protein phosphatase [Succinivibrio sp.]|nr:low molecular weight phosphotyrosine protein phosphatase [Succinivibrio sp.]